MFSGHTYNGKILKDSGVPLCHVHPGHLAPDVENPMNDGMCPGDIGPRPVDTEHPQQ